MKPRNHGAIYEGWREIVRRVGIALAVHSHTVISSSFASYSRRLSDLCTGNFAPWSSPV